MYEKPPSSHTTSAKVYVSVGPLDLLLFLPGGDDKLCHVRVCVSVYFTFDLEPSNELVRTYVRDSYYHQSTRPPCICAVGISSKEQHSYTE
jgi:hypothetical protein